MSKLKELVIGRLRHLGKEPTAAEVVRCEEAVAKGTPLSRATGIAFFANAVLRTQGVLCPRADSETVVEAAVAHMTGDSVVDLGCGSGALLIGFLQLGGRPSVKRALAIDVSEEACRTARLNVDSNQCGDVEVRQQSWRDPAPAEFDVALWNPPYVKSSECHGDDPLLALDGGEDGLKWYRQPPWHWVKKGGVVSVAMWN